MQEKPFLCDAALTSAPETEVWNGPRKSEISVLSTLYIPAMDADVHALSTLKAI